ncbi:hypothetical protein ACQ4LF_25185, partial [Aeromonas salmonicida]
YKRQLHSSDLRVEQLEEGQDRLIEGVRRVYEEVLAQGRARCKPEQALIAMGHAPLGAGPRSRPFSYTHLTLPPT